MNIEKRLTEAIGEAGGRLHTARSRNDQVALDTHMYVRRETVEVINLIKELQTALTETATKYKDVSCLVILTFNVHSLFYSLII